MGQQERARAMATDMPVHVGKHWDKGGGACVFVAQRAMCMLRVHMVGVGD